MTYLNKKALYICVDLGYIEIPKEIKNQTIIFNEDIKKFFEEDFFKKLTGLSSCRLFFTYYNKKIK